MMATYKFIYEPRAGAVKTGFEVFCILVSLQVALPVSISIFNPVAVLKGKDLEPEFHPYENIYFNKGL